MINPYQAPAKTDHGVEFRAVAGVRSRLASKGLLYRRVIVDAPVEAVIEFNGRSLRDRILVDDEVVAWKVSWWQITPEFQFHLSTLDGAVLPVKVKVSMGRLLRIRSFEIEIDGTSVYAEQS